MFFVHANVTCKCWNQPSHGSDLLQCGLSEGKGKERGSHRFDTLAETIDHSWHSSENVVPRVLNPLWQWLLALMLGIPLPGDAERAFEAAVYGGALSLTKHRPSMVDM